LSFRPRGTYATRGFKNQGVEEAVAFHATIERFSISKKVDFESQLQAFHEGQPNEGLHRDNQDLLLQAKSRLVMAFLCSIQLCRVLLLSRR
jgi:hypothetical protein